MNLTALLFVTGFIFGCGLAFVRHPIYGLLTYLAAFYLSPPDRWWGQGLLLEVRWSLVAGVVTLLAVWVRNARMTRPSVPFLRHSVVRGLLVFIAWVAIGSFWALDPEMHALLLEMYVKFLIAMYLIYRCLDSERHLRFFLWSHVLGCFYLGLQAYSSSVGGRYEFSAGSGIGEANSGALQLVTGAAVAGGLFLAGSIRSRVVLLGMVPLIINGIVATISRSGFLAMVAAGIVFNLFSPKRLRARILVLSVLAGVLLLMLTNVGYWDRIQTIQYAGEQRQDVDTGAGRREVLAAQWKMFQQRPLGCGHMCTSVLSPDFVEERFLSEGARASHNTFMTALVDHGVVGGLLYLGLAAWIVWTVWRVRSSLQMSHKHLANWVVTTASCLAAIFVGDLFVQYPRFEARWWFVAILMVLTSMARGANESIAEAAASSADVPVGRS